jgi:dTDP-3-amino-3,4,6-trideoxy-alpha-D-glucose transaminase
VNPTEASIPFMDLAAARVELEGAIEAAVARVASSDWYLLGPELESFERSWAEYCGTRHCVGVGSGMSAIELALRAGGVGEGDEVIVPAYTWIATWLAVTRAGAVPVPVDVVPATYNLDPDLIGDAISTRTAAILPVHLRGEPADMTGICEIAERHSLLVIEDAAQAHGAAIEGKRVGGFGAAGAFSFYPSKNLGALGDGGAVVTDDGDLAERVRLLRNYGMRNRYEIEAAGFNSRLAEIQAAVLMAKLPLLDGWNEARRKVAARYSAQFGSSESVTIPLPPDWAEPVWHLYVVGCAKRDSRARALSARGINTLVHYPILPHLSEPYAERGWVRGSFPVAEELCDTTLSLPMYPQLSPGACDAVADALLEVCAEG